MLLICVSSTLECISAGGEKRVDDELVSEASGEMQRRVAVIIHFVHVRPYSRANSAFIYTLLLQYIRLSALPVYACTVLE